MTWAQRSMIVVDLSDMVVDDGKESLKCFDDGSV